MSYYVFLIASTILFSIAMVFTSIIEAIRGKRNLAVFSMLSLALYFAFLYIQYILKLQVNTFTILFLLITLVGNYTVGYGFDLYNRSRHYDRYLHAFGSFSFALFFYSFLSQIFKYFSFQLRTPKIYTALFITAIGISVGCIVEITEFMLDLKTKKHRKHQRGLKDTNYDLISNVIGAVLAGGCSFFIFL